LRSSVTGIFWRSAMTYASRDRYDRVHEAAGLLRMWVLLVEAARSGAAYREKLIAFVLLRMEVHNDWSSV